MLNRALIPYSRVVFHDEDGLGRIADYRNLDLSIDFWSGTHVDQAELVPLELEGVGPLGDYVANPLRWPIVSKRLAEHLQAVVSSGHQFIKIKIHDSASSTTTCDHCVLNVINKCECLDLERSVLHRDHNGKPVTVTTPHIILEKTKGMPIFRLTECPEAGWFLRNDIIGTFRGKAFTGIAFINCPIA